MFAAAMLLFAGGQDVNRVEAVLKEYHELTRAETPCRDRARDEIVVCARRDAERYRLPLPSVPSPRGAELRTARLLDPHAPACGMGAFTVGCGKVGAGMTVSFGSGAGSGSTHFETDHQKEP
jgi:hypothetical protein